ncbi:transcription factor MYC2 [Brachypodium distachyon]|uniref:Transcription factor n=1 Tax=Brachypodium distachyon TaxID=15368 RepID=I1IRX4_BRADI|nr:transcription factor MYC2 [Brachypodium distachyon]KQJ91080.1 hypothetical protein BRADI_4g35400v3 [Brachypodium distachyon]|eukprot:XP_003576740.1 transcription factor MYC2 [Brachypodium distachyon]
MDELLSPCSSFFAPPSPPSNDFSPAGHGQYHQQQQVLEFASCDVPEQWLLGDIYVSSAKSEDNGDDYGNLMTWPHAAAGCSLSPGSDLSDLPAAAPHSTVGSSCVVLPASSTPHRAGPATAAKRRGRKPGPRPEGPTVSHVEAERQRRDKLNRRFCDLRAAVPTVSRMDKASLLADAAAYIAELRARVARLEDEGRQAAAARWPPDATTTTSGAAASAAVPHFPADETAAAVEVRMVGREAAAVRVTTAAAHAPARLMGALRALELQVQHACVSRVQGVTVQDVVVDVPAVLRQQQQQGDDGGGALRSALLQRLQDSTA